MVVLAASICTKAGKAVMSRQFVEMPRSRIEGLLASFPKLIGTSDQHTFVETETVRYVYQPLEDLFIVLITTKTSNILEDITTLHLFSRLISDTVRSPTEREISLQSFDLIHLFDEVISLGYRENVNLAQIRTISEMESHEERVQAEIAKNQEKHAKEDAKRKAKMLDMQKREAMKSGAGGYGSGGYGSGGFGSGGYGGGAGIGGFRSGSPYEPVRQATPEPERPSYSASAAATTSAATAGRGKGMQLGRKQADNVFVNTIKADEGIPDVPPPVVSPVTGGAPVHTPAVPTEPIHLTIEEKLAVTLTRDGGLQSMELKGEMSLLITDSSKSHLRIALDMKNDPAIQYKTHPNVDKKLFGEGVLGLRDASRPFPTGQPLGVLKWRLVGKDESAVPLAINCWPSPTGTGTTDVNIEYELQSDTLTLQDIIIAIPYPGSQPPTITDIEGHYEIDRARKLLHWQIPLIDQSNKSGVLEFSVEGDDAGAFFPVRVSFRSASSFCGVGVREVKSVEGVVMPFGQEVVLGTEEYTVV